MESVLWIGPRKAPAALIELLSQKDVELKMLPDANAALDVLDRVEAAAAIVVASWVDAAKTVERLRSDHPDVQVLLASDTGLARPLVLAMWAGAAGVLEFRSQSKNEIVLSIQESVARHREVMRERDLLLRLHMLNEEFLKQIVAAEKRNLELQEKVERPRASDEGPAQVLVIDDEPVVLDVMKRIVERAGHQCVTVSDGEAALGALYERGFHLVITDKNLPGISGIEVISQVKQLSPDTDVMMITGYSSKEAAIDAMNSGASGYLEKPFDDIVLVKERIEKVLTAQRERLKNQRFLQQIKDRNRDFLDRYKVLRADLEAWMAAHNQAVLSP